MLTAARELEVSMTQVASGSSWLEEQMREDTPTRLTYLYQ